MKMKSKKMRMAISQKRVFKEKVIAVAEIDDFDNPDKLVPVFDEALKQNAPVSSIECKFTADESPSLISDEEREMMSKVYSAKLTADIKKRQEDLKNMKISFRYPSYNEIKTIDINDLKSAEKTGKHKKSKIESMVEGVARSVMMNSSQFSMDEQAKLAEYAILVLCEDVISANIKDAFEENQQFLNPEKIIALKEDVNANLDGIQDQLKNCEKAFYEAIRVNDTNHICEGIKDEERKLLGMTLGANAIFKEYADYCLKAQVGVDSIVTGFYNLSQNNQLLDEKKSDEEMQPLISRFLAECPDKGLKEVFEEHSLKYCSLDEIAKIKEVTFKTRDALKDYDEFKKGYVAAVTNPIAHIKGIKEDFTKHATLEHKPQNQYVLKIYGKEPKVDMPKL